MNPGPLSGPASGPTGEPHGQGVVTGREPEKLYGAAIVVVTGTAGLLGFLGLLLWGVTQLR